MLLCLVRRPRRTAPQPLGRDWVRLVSTWPTGKTQTDAICLRRRRGNRGPPAPAGSASGSNPARLGVFCEGATRSLLLRVLGADFSGREGRLDELRVQVQRGGRGGPRPCPAPAASSPPGPLVLLTDRVTASAGLPAPEPLSGTGKSLPRPPDTLPSALRGSIVPDICQGFWKS